MSYHRLWSSGWAVVVAAGVGLGTLLWAPANVLFLAGTLSVFAWVVQVVVLPAGSTGADGLPAGAARASVRAVCAGGAAVAAAATATLSPSLAALLTLAAATSSPLVLRWLAGGRSVARNVDPLMSWSDAQLEAAWRDAFIDPQRGDSVADIAELVALRERHLDELERRDPGAFARWLSGAVSYPPHAPHRQAR
jgi:hypothetical protein